MDKVHAAVALPWSGPCDAKLLESETLETLIFSILIRFDQSSVGYTELRRR